MESWEIIVHIVIPIGAIVVSIVGAMLTVAWMWGKVNQIVTGLVNRVEVVEQKQDVMIGNTTQAAMTHAQCSHARNNCSQMICGKLDDMRQAMVAMDRRYEGNRNEMKSLEVQIAKIAQCIDDWRANAKHTRRWTDVGAQNVRISEESLGDD